MSNVYSPLNADRQSLLPGLGCSVIVHGGVGLTWLAFSVLMAQCGPSKPIIDLDQTMEVSLIAKSDLPLPERATRAPVPSGAPEPTPQPVDVPPPPVESDLAFKTEKAKAKPKGQPSDVNKALEELERQRMMDELMNAPEGKVNRSATDPNGAGDITLNPGANASGDPEYAAYIAKVQAIFMQHFRPLKAVTEANPGLVCSVKVEVDPGTMAVTSYTIVKSSGVPSYDAAAERAAAAVTSLPMPPEKYRSMLAAGYTMNFRGQ